MKAGFIGLGNMGTPMAGRLLKAGHDLIVFDVVPKILETFTQQNGGYQAKSIREVGEKSEIIITMLPNSEIVRNVTLGKETLEDSLAGSMGEGALLVDMSSSSPTATMTLGNILKDYGISMLDAPVSGGVSRAKAGNLAIMVGGKKADIERCRPLFDAMGSRVFETGELGSAHAMKVLNNMVSAAGMIAAAEALFVGMRFGMQPSVMLEVLNASTGKNNSTENKFGQFILSRHFNSGFSIENMAKDLTLAVELAHNTKTPVPMGAICRELWESAKMTLPSGADHTSVVRWYEDILKMELSTESVDINISD